MSAASLWWRFKDLYKKNHASMVFSRTNVYVYLCVQAIQLTSVLEISLLGMYIKQ